MSRDYDDLHGGNEIEEKAEAEAAEDRPEASGDPDAVPDGDEEGERSEGPGALPGAGAGEGPVPEDGLPGESGDGESDHGEGDAPAPGRRRAAAVAAGIAGVLLVAAAAWALTGGAGPISPAPSAGSGSAAGSADAAGEATAITLAIDAEGWGEGSSPFVVLIDGVTDAGEEVRFAHAVWPGDDGRIELEPGDYTLTWISAVNGDGSIYLTGGPVSVGAHGGEAPLQGSFERVPADQVTQEQVDEILGQLGEAAGVGDGTMSGDAAQEAIDAAAGNAAANPALDAAEVEQAGAAAGSAAGGSEGGASQSGQQSGGPASSGGSSSGGGSGGGQSRPQHTHSWQAVTEQRQVLVQAAYDERVDTGRAQVVCDCGATFSNTDSWLAHATSSGCGGYSAQPIYETVHHPAVYETQTVTVGYRCSCGATK